MLVIRISLAHYSLADDSISRPAMLARDIIFSVYLVWRAI